MARLLNLKHFSESYLLPVNRGSLDSLRGLRHSLYLVEIINQKQGKL